MKYVSAFARSNGRFGNSRSAIPLLETKVRFMRAIIDTRHYTIERVNVDADARAFARIFRDAGFTDFQRESARLT